MNITNSCGQILNSSLSYLFINLAKCGNELAMGLHTSLTLYKYIFNSDPLTHVSSEDLKGKSLTAFKCRSR